MKNKHLLVIIISVGLVVLLISLPTTHKQNIQPVQSTVSERSILPDEDLKNAEFARYAAEDLIEIKKLDSLSFTTKNTLQLQNVYKKLADLSMHQLKSNILYYYYIYKGMITSQSAQQIQAVVQEFIDNILFLDNNELQYWFVEKTKQLITKQIELNYKNDSTDVNKAICDLYSGNNPMNAVNSLKEIEQKKTQNSYASYILAIASKKSGQYQKAIDRFFVILQNDKNNVEVLFQLAECYELINNKPKAIETYQNLKKYIKIKNAKNEIDKRIIELKK